MRCATDSSSMIEMNLMGPAQRGQTKASIENVQFSRALHADTILGSCEVRKPSGETALQAVAAQRMLTVSNEVR